MPPRVAILPWGNLIEHYLDPIGLDLRSFATEMSGGWLFGYAEALRSSGIDSVILCTSRAVMRPERLVNPQTGLVTLALPVPRAFLRAVALVGDPDVAPASGPRRLVQELAARSSLDIDGVTDVLRQERCTMLLCQEYEHARFASASAAARRAGVACFATFQGGTGSGKALLQLRRLSIVKADGLVIASADEAERVQSAYGIAPRAVLKLANPLSPDLWFPEDRQEARARLGVPPQAFVVICHGRIDWVRKGVDVLLAGWRVFADRYPDRDIRLRIIGSGADDARLEAELRAAPARGVDWTPGFSNDRAALRTELSAADVYVLSSRHEGFPVAPLEAMACGLPVILSDAPGTADILAEGEASGGLRIARGDPSALVCALERLLLNEDDRAKLAQAAIARVNGYASMAAVGRDLAAFLRARSALRPS